MAGNECYRRLELPAPAFSPAIRVYLIRGSLVGRSFRNANRVATIIGRPIRIERAGGPESASPDVQIGSTTRIQSRDSNALRMLSMIRLRSTSVTPA